MFSPGGEDGLVKDKVFGNHWDEKEVQEPHGISFKENPQDGFLIL